MRGRVAWIAVAGLAAAPGREAAMQPGSLSGHVMSGGAPAARFQIVCDGPAGERTTVSTGLDGTYAFEDVVPGAYTCTANTATADAIDRIAVAAGPVVHDFTLATYGQLTGAVVNASNDTPVENAEVLLQYGSDARTARPRGRTDALGHFAVTHVTAGAGAVIIVVVDPPRRLVQPFAMPAGGQLELGTLKLEPRATAAAP